MQIQPRTRVIKKIYPWQIFVLIYKGWFNITEFESTCRILGVPTVILYQTESSGRHIGLSEYKQLIYFVQDETANYTFFNSFKIEYFVFVKKWYERG